MKIIVNKLKESKNKKYTKRTWPFCENYRTQEKYDAIQRCFIFNHKVNGTYKVYILHLIFEDNDENVKYLSFNNGDIPYSMDIFNAMFTYDYLFVRNMSDRMENRELTNDLTQGYIDFKCI